MPPEVVGQALRAAVSLPGLHRLEGLVVEDRDASRTLLAGATESTEIEAGRVALQGVRAGVAGLLRQCGPGNGAYQMRRARVGLGVEDVDVGRAQARDEEVAPVQVGGVVPGVAEGGAAGIPAEVVQLVTGSRHVHPADDPAVVG
jgi:hypothetical protein